MRYSGSLVLLVWTTAIQAVKEPFLGSEGVISFRQEERTREGEPLSESDSVLTETQLWHREGPGSASAKPPVHQQTQAFSFASYYDNHMVLQRSPKKAAVWGWAPVADVGKTVTVEISADLAPAEYQKTYETAVKDGPKKGTALWWLQLDPMEDEGPFSIQATLGSNNSVTLTDVLFGDVWICSGQSNMEFTTDMMMNATEELNNAHLYPKIRLFTVAQNTSSVPLYDLRSIEEMWSLPSKDTVGHSEWTYFSAVCWLYGKNIFKALQRPIGLVATTWGGTPVEAWSSPEALRTCGLKPSLIAGPSGHSVLWNAMVHPLLPMTIYGAIWYQGEANAEAPNTYNCTFPSMVDNWRKNFHITSDGETDVHFPFGFVQLATNNPAPNVTGGFPDIRWHQTADLGYVPNHRLHNVFMAVAMDLRDDSSPYTPIHPRDKTTVGERLALAGLAVAYQRTSQRFQGPFPREILLDETKHSLSIVYDQQVVVKARDGFEVCCSPDGTTKCPMSGMDGWVSATITSSDSDSVTVSTQGCTGKYVVGVRYAWRMTPCPYKECALYGAEGDIQLPAPPYINMDLAGQRQEGESTASFGFASYYASHMVLQRAPRKATIWGYAPLQEMGHVVQVDVNSENSTTKYQKTYSTHVIEGLNSTAIWKLQLDPMDDEGPFSIQASLGGYSPVTLTDVLFGDVWICSGQSNMQFITASMFNASEELANAHLFPKIRFMTSERHARDTPQMDLPGIGKQWTLPNNETVKTFSAVCWLYGKNVFKELLYPVGLVEVDWGGTCIEEWSSATALRTCGRDPNASYCEVSTSGTRHTATDPIPRKASALWNSMIHPLLPLTIYGAIWYQGEQNRMHPDTYNCTFPAMILDWRKNFHSLSDGETDPYFPFGFVQIATDDPTPNATGGFPDIRWHQTADLGYAPNHRLHNVFMAVAMDLRDDGSPMGPVHPRDKTTVGERLALSGLAIAYHRFGQCFQGPFPQELILNQAGNSLTMLYDKQVVVKSKDGFEVCCSPDGVTKCAMSDMDGWVAATITNSDSDSVTVSTQGCTGKYVVGIRYAWRMTPCPYKECAVYSAEGDIQLPAPQYINMDLA